MRSQENIYVIEENIYEMEDPYEYYCYVNNEQQSWQPRGLTLYVPPDPTTSFLSIVSSLKTMKCVKWSVLETLSVATKQSFYTFWW